MFYTSMLLISLGLALLGIFFIKISVSKPDEKAETEDSIPEAGIKYPVSPNPPKEKQSAPAETPPPDKDTESDVLLKRIDPETLARAVKVYSKEEKESDPPLIIGGILYLSQSRHIPFYFDESKRTKNIYADLKRIGKSSLVVDGSSFLIHAENVSYTYSSFDLEEILFKDKGLALIPAEINRPIPVFISDEPDKIKNYIKKRAKLIPR